MKRMPGPHFEVVKAYRRPAAEADFVETLRLAVQGMRGIREAYLVDRKQTIDGHDDDYCLGVAARLGAWRFRSTSDTLDAALHLRPPSDDALIWWSSYGNSPVNEEIRRVGIPIAQVRDNARHRLRLG